MASIDGDFTRARAYTAAKALLARRPDLDAIFAACDVSAMGVLQALREAGRRVPDDVAVVSFDGSALAEAADLSSVYMPVEDEAAAAIRRLLDPALPNQGRLPTTLTLRGSKLDPHTRRSSPCSTPTCAACSTEPPSPTSPPSTRTARRTPRPCGSARRGTWIVDAGSRKARNLRHDPRVAVSVVAPDNPYAPAVVRGRVTGWIDGDAGWAIIDRVAANMGGPYDRSQERIVAVIEPEHQKVGLG